ncbi:protein kinase domain-containing protein [Roseateles sp.]|uniref:serine/threonine-protein kinase n=1 Tax=Roseateles sp. TaxID=1971397 RepID=UPI003BA9A2B6
MTTTPQDLTPDWPLVRRLFDQALQLAPHDRAAFVQAQAMDEASRAELRSLLSHHNEATEGEPLLANSPALAPQAGASRTGEHFGPWVIVGPLGVGGMGEVFEARRADGSYEGRAAIKVLKRGAGDSAAVLQRFMQERQALARLEHPNIARMLDAGLSGDGLPYFVMEYVDGQPIDAAALGLPLEQRLGLFLQLADAVAYAHRNLLVHRDLKPGNVLVTAEQQVKLLDFGIAKALDPLDGAAPEATLDGARPFTPNYASPEQVRGEPVGTATDIYSLGCLLYLMLTGVRATGRNAATAAEAAQAVLLEAPTRPSTLPDTTAQDPAWPQLRRRVAGDLDNIVLQALEKSPQHRYSSVEAMSDDIRRYLGGHPVRAHKAGALYVFGKFVRRNRLAVAAVSTAVLALAVGLGTALWQAREARLARDDAQAHLKDLRAITRELVGKFADAVTYIPGGMKIKEDLLNQTVKSLDRLAQSSDRDPGLMTEVVASYARLAELQGNDQGLALGKPDAAKVNADKAVAMAEQVLAGNRGEWRLASWAARAYDIRAKLLRAQGRVPEALKEIDAAAKVLELADLSRADAMGRVSIPSEAAGLLIMRGQLTGQLVIKQQAPLAEAFAALDRAAALMTPLLDQRPLLEALDLSDGRPEDPKAYAQILTNLGVIHGAKAKILHGLEQWDPSVPESAEAVRLDKAAVAYDPKPTIWKDTLAIELNNLALGLIHQQRYAEALAAAEESRATAQLLIQQDGPKSRWVGMLPRLAIQRGRALAGVGRHAEALAAYEEGIAYWTSVLKSPPSDGVRLEAERALGVLRTAQTASR